MESMELTHAVENGHIDFRIGAGIIHIDLIWVDEDSRIRGVGTDLLLKVLSLADNLGFSVELESRGDIDRAVLRAFYEKHGFVMVDNTPWIQLMRREVQQ
jgi:GNAT superfamily N-acetyltransferase